MFQTKVFLQYFSCRPTFKVPCKSHREFECRVDHCYLSIHSNIKPDLTTQSVVRHADRKTWYNKGVDIDYSNRFLQMMQSYIVLHSAHRDFISRSWLVWIAVPSSSWYARSSNSTTLPFTLTSSCLRGLISICTGKEFPDIRTKACQFVASDKSPWNRTEVSHYLQDASVY